VYTCSNENARSGEPSKILPLSLNMHGRLRISVLPISYTAQGRCDNVSFSRRLYRAYRSINRHSRQQAGPSPRSHLYVYCVWMLRLTGEIILLRDFFIKHNICGMIWGPFGRREVMPEFGSLPRKSGGLASLQLISCHKIMQKNTSQQKSLIRLTDPGPNMA
jgi:hypothetical protein